MALTQTDVDNLESALASGELTVEYDGRRVTFRSVAELVQALAYAKQEVAAASAAGNVTQSFAGFTRD